MNLYEQFDGRHVSVTVAGVEGEHRGSCAVHGDWMEVNDTAIQVRHVSTIREIDAHAVVR